MSTTTDPPQIEPEVLFIRRVLRGICVVTTFFSAFFAASGLQMAAQLVEDEVPAGKVESILGQTKTRTRVQLENGPEAQISKLVPVRIAVGDHIAKRRDSFDYVVNGKAVTDFSWVLHNWLLPLHLLIPLGVYLLVGTIYVFSYRRTPLGEQIWPDDKNPPRRPRTRAGMILVLCASWLAAVMLVAVFFGCIGGCIGGVFNQLRG